MFGMCVRKGRVCLGVCVCVWREGVCLGWFFGRERGRKGCFGGVCVWESVCLCVGGRGKVYVYVCFGGRKDVCVREKIMRKKEIICVFISVCETERIESINKNNNNNNNNLYREWTE